MMKESDKNEVRRIAKRHRSAPKIVNAASIPARDETDAYGNPFLGIPPDRLKEFGITQAEQATNSTTNRVLASSPSTNADRAVDTDSIKDDAVKKRTIPNGEVDNDLLAGTSVSTGKLQDKSATGAKIASSGHGVEPLGNANVNDDSLRAISGDHVKTKTLEGFHLKDNSIGGRVVNLSMSDIGGKIGPGRIKGKIPKSKISGINWEDVDGKPPLATTNYVDGVKADIKRWAKNEFSKKGHNHA